MNYDALAIISGVICTIGAISILACAAYGAACIVRGDRRSRSQLRRNLGTLEAGR